MSSHLTLDRLCQCLSRLAPLEYADRTWDNVGLLLEGHKRDRINKVMVCNDLTDAVLAEAVDQQVDAVVAYHPTWFRAEKQMTLSGPLGKLCKAAMHGISVYSPHTALDAVPGGINDHLLNIFKVNQDSIKAVAPCSDMTDGGYGRVGTLSEVISAEDACQLVMRSLSLNAVRLAKPNNLQGVKTVAVCAGSGGSILTPKLAVDLVVTGELSHHQVLALQAANTAVILTEHSNSERYYLKNIYLPRIREALAHANVSVFFSESDREPLSTVVLSS